MRTPVADPAESLAHRADGTPGSFEPLASGTAVFL